MNCHWSVAVHFVVPSARRPLVQVLPAQSLPCMKDGNEPWRLLAPPAFAQICSWSALPRPRHHPRASVPLPLALQYN